MPKPAKKTQKPAKQLIPKSPPVWVFNLFMIVLILIIPFVYVKTTLDHTLLPRFVVLACTLQLLLVFLLFYPKAELPEMKIIARPPLIIWALFIVSGMLSFVNALNQGEMIYPLAKDILFLLVFLFAAGSFYRIKDLSAVSTALLFLVLANMLIGYFEYFTYVFRHINLDDLYKLKGVMAHKNVFAGMLLLMLPFVVNELFHETRLRRIFFGIVCYAMLVLIMLIQTRAVWFGVLVFTIVMTVLMLITAFAKGDKVIRRRVFRSSLIYLAVLVLAFISGWQINNYSVNNPLLFGRDGIRREITTTEERLASMADLSSENNQRRLEIWSISLKMIKDEPLSGHGVGNWKIVVPKYFYESYITSFFHNWRRPHNDFLWIAAERGIPGLIFYLAFFAFLLYYCIKIAFSSVELKKKVFVSLMIGGIAGYFMDSMFAFPYERIEQQIFVMILAGGIMGVVHREFPTKSSYTLNRKIFFPVSISITAIIIFIGVKIWKAEENVNMTHSATAAGKYELAVEFADKAYSRIYSVDAMNVPIKWFRGNANIKGKNIAQAAIDFELALKDSPYSTMVYADLGSAYGQLNRHEDAIDMFKDAYSIYPGNVDVLKNLGVAYYHLDSLDKSIEWFYGCYFASGDTTIWMIIKELEMRRDSAQFSEGIMNDN